MKRDVDILAFGAAVLYQDLRDTFGDFSLLVGGAPLDPRVICTCGTGFPPWNGCVSIASA